MANYQNNRIRCGEETALQLITSPWDGYNAVMDFRKALSMKPDDKKYQYEAVGSVCRKMEDGRYDFGFSTRWYTNLDVIRAFISRYRDAEWWILQDYVDIIHYYWADGEVIEDTHQITEAEDETISEMMDEEDKGGLTETIDHYFLFFTEKEDQSRYVNFHPDTESGEYAAYMDLVRKIAEEIVEEGTFYGLKEYGYNWEGAHLYCGLPLSIRVQYLYKRMENLSAYKLNIMSRDVLEEVRKRVFPYNKKLYDAVFGLAIGDALGVPYEFMERGTFECTGMKGYGTHHQPAGTWSDDTALALATLKSLKDNRGRVDVEDIRKNFLLWYREKAFTTDGTLFDIGISTARALQTGKPCTGERENGNGSLMRILPLAFVDCTDDEIRAVSAITHGHWISQEACVIYVHAAKRLLAGENIEDIIPTLVYDKPFDRLRRINELDVSEIRSSGYVVDTLEAALWAVSRVERDEEEPGYCILRDYKRIVLEAVNLGDDTDTVAAVTGGLAGIIHGLEYGSYEWINEIRNKELVLSCLWDRL